MKTKYIRYTRIIKHSILYAFTLNIEHYYEVTHYFYMKKFSDIDN